MLQPDGKGGYLAQTTLPAHSVTRVTWEIRMLLEAGGEHLRWPLLFATESA